MSIQDVLTYVNFRSNIAEESIAEIYGTEHFGVFLYSLIRMERPKVIVELGAGGCATTCLAAEALRENRQGRLWAVDNGADWARVLRRPCQQALGYQDVSESYPQFFLKLVRRFELESSVTYVDAELKEREFFTPPDGQTIGLLFADAPPSDARGCVDLLRYYLPRMNQHSSIFIDRASTINHSYLLLNHIIDQLNIQKIPRSLLAGLSDEEENALRTLARDCRFTIIHLTEANEGKRNKLQNSRAWIRIEPNDYLPHNNVASLVRMLPPGARSGSPG